MESPTVLLLNSLSRICNDAREDFRLAADAAQDIDLRNLFIAESDRRYLMGNELKAEVVRLHGIPEFDGSVTGSLGRAWQFFKAKIGTNDHSILTGLEAEESKALTSYQNALQQEYLTDELRALINRHFEVIRTVHGRIQQLRDRELFKTKSA